MSELKTDKISPRTASGTITLGDSGDTFTIPSGATLSGAGSITVPSGGSLTINSGATVTNNGTASGFGGGKVLQVVQGTYATQTSTTSSTFVTTNLSASITPSSTSNKVFVTGVVNSFYAYGGSPSGAYIAIYRDGSSLVSNAGWTYSASSTGVIHTVPFSYLDSPSSTSSLTYEIYFKRHSGTTVNAHDSGNQSHIILMEIEG